jgi:serine/threonine protein kinase
MAFDSWSFAYGLVVTICEGASGVVGLENSRSFPQLATFEEKYDILSNGNAHADVGVAGTFGPTFPYASLRVAALKQSNEYVLVKTCNRLSMSAADEELVRSEGGILKTLYHNSIISCFDFFEEPSVYHIVYEKAEGGLLLHRLANRKSLNEKTIRDIFEGLVEAVKYCHDKNIVHR